MTRVLNLIGVDLGSDDALTTEPIAANPRGYWEHHELTAISDAILKRYGGSWDQPPQLSRGWEFDPGLNDLRKKARRLIRDQFAQVQLWGWKDPRTCITLPFWQQLIPSMRYIIVLRNPIDVARSLAHRDGLSPEESSHLWVTYVSSALSYSEGKPRLVTFYEDLMDDCLRELRRLADFLGAAERAQEVERQKAVQEFIEEGLQHYRSSIAETTADSGIDPRAIAIYLNQRATIRHLVAPN